MQVVPRGLCNLVLIEDGAFYCLEGTTMNESLAIIGAGNMAESIIAGVLSDGHRWPPRRILVTNRSHGKLERLAARWGVQTSYDNADAAAWGDTMLLAVKPVDMRAALASLAGAVAGKLLITRGGGRRASPRCRAGWAPAAAGRAGDAEHAGAGGRGDVGLGGERAGDARRNGAWVRQLLGALGREIAMPREEALDQVTAVSGSGPAYLFYLAEDADRLGPRDRPERGRGARTGVADDLGRGQDAARGHRRAEHPAPRRHLERRHDRGGPGRVCEGDLSGVISRGVHAAYRRGGEIRRKLAAE